MPEYDVFLHPRTRIRYRVDANNERDALQQALSLYERTDEYGVFLPLQDISSWETSMEGIIDEFMDLVEELKDTAIISLTVSC
jgi:hypothetical protein